MFGFIAVSVAAGSNEPLVCGVADDVVTVTAESEWT